MAFRFGKRTAEKEPEQRPEQTLSVSRVLDIIGSVCSEFYHQYGEPLFRETYRTCMLTIKGVIRRLKRFYRFLFRKFSPKLKEAKVSCLRLWEEIQHGVRAPFFKVRRGFYLMERNYRMAAEAEGRRNGLLLCIRTFAEGFANNRRLIRHTLNYVLPVVLVLILSGVVMVGQNLTFAVQVYYNGQAVGYIEDETVFEDAERLMQQRIIYEQGEETIDIIPQYTVSLVNRADILDENQLADNMIQLSDLNIVEAEGLYIGDEFYGAVTDSEVVVNALEGILDSYRADTSVQNVEFEQPYEFRKGLYLASSVVDANELATLVTSDKEAELSYTVQAGDTPYEIAQANGISLDSLVALNPNILTSCFPGDVVKISGSVPFMSVKVSKTVTYEESIPYETVEVSDKKYMKGTKVTTQEGENGVRQVTATIDYVNGVEVNRTVLDSVVTKEPVQKQVTVGSAEPISIAPSGSSPQTGSGAFINPCPSGYVSQEYGHYGHKGMDIASGYGNPIYASAGGTVILARWYSDYGKCVMIDHGNGVVTLYGHASALYVSAGQTVAQGQVIAAVGSTGQSTGNHCHFEVRVNGRTTNPRYYL